MNKYNRFKNKSFSILGDSISTLEGYSDPKDAAFYSGMYKYEASVFTPSDTWWGLVTEYFQGSILVNNSFTGSTVIKHPECLIKSYGCSDERTCSLARDRKSPDVIIVWMGTNDWGWGAPLTSTVSDDFSVFSNAYGHMLQKLHNNYPDAVTVCFTLCVNNDKAVSRLASPFGYGKYPLEEYNDVIRNVTQNHDCVVADLHKYLNSFSTIDGFHPDSDGMKTIAQAAIKAMEELNENN